MKLAIVIAAYNEEQSISGVLETLPKQLPGITDIMPIVVDDGSQDKTVETACSYQGVHVLRHLINRGQGAALKTGFEYALKQGYEIIVTFDADGQHKSDEIEDVIAPILSHKAEVVLGSRFLNRNAENLPSLRRLILKGGVLFTHIFSRLKVTDTHNGFRAFHGDALKKMRLVQDKMEHASEILDQISRHKISYTEVPVTIRYSDYSKEKGQRHSNAFRIAIKMLIYKITQ